MFVDSEKNSQSSKEFLFVCFDDKIISFYDKTKYIYKICTGCKYIKKMLHLVIYEDIDSNDCYLQPPHKSTKTSFSVYINKLCNVIKSG